MAYLPRYLFAGQALVDDGTLQIESLLNNGQRRSTRSKTKTTRRRDARVKQNTKGKRYKLSSIADRDDYRCHLCLGSVDMELSGHHPDGPTADHLLPVAHGGGDEEHNIRLAHRRCNVRRGTRPMQPSV